jgi:hypothetical protein
MSSSKLATERVKKIWAELRRVGSENEKCQIEMSLFRVSRVVGLEVLALLVTRLTIFVLCLRQEILLVQDAVPSPVFPIRTLRASLSS